MDDFISINYKGYLPNKRGDEKKVEDSKVWFNHKPKVFQLGHYEVSKCWDIALQ